MLAAASIRATRFDPARCVVVAARVVQERRWFAPYVEVETSSGARAPLADVGGEPLPRDEAQHIADAYPAGKALDCSVQRLDPNVVYAKPPSSGEAPWIAGALALAGVASLVLGGPRRAPRHDAERGGAYRSAEASPPGGPARAMTLVPRAGAVSLVLATFVAAVGCVVLAVAADFAWRGAPKDLGPATLSAFFGLTLFLPLVGAASKRTLFVDEDARLITDIRSVGVSLWTRVVSFEGAKAVHCVTRPLGRTVTHEVVAILGEERRKLLDAPSFDVGQSCAETLDAIVRGAPDSGEPGLPPLPLR